MMYQPDEIYLSYLIFTIDSEKDYFISRFMHARIQQMIRHSPVITDGAWGTQLQSFGLRIGECPDELNLSHPELVERVARSYIDAGSKIILTNTFGANRIGLQRYGLEDKTVLINIRGVELSKLAADENVKVFASIGPTGKMLMSGDLSEDELFSVFHEQAQAIAQAGADAIVIETMSDLDEVRIAIHASRETNLPIVACMVFDSGTDCDRTMMGNTPEEVVGVLTLAGADVIGANCGQGISGFISICERFRAATDLPIWIKANAGLPAIVDDRAEYTMTPDEFAEHIPTLVQAGANFIGGCCGTRPDFIKKIVHAIEQMKSENI